MTAVVATLTLATAPSLGADPGMASAKVRALMPRIQAAREKTWACETTLGIQHTPASRKTPGSTAYARWVLGLWTIRASAACRLARNLTDVGVLRRVVDRCLAGIIKLENNRWDPTVDFGWGHGNVHEAYGIPQANPGTKMASAGADWRTNPLVQLRWMASYVRGRYGSACAALEHRLSQGWY